MKAIDALCVLTLGQLSDIFTTVKGITTFGVPIETNSIISNIYLTEGVIGIVLVKLLSLCVVSLLVIAGCMYGYTRYVLTISITLGVILLIISISNIYTLTLWGLSF